MRRLSQSFRRMAGGLAMLLAVVSAARADVTVRVSVKFILNASGLRPTFYGAGFGSASIRLSTDQEVQDNIAYQNDLMTRAGRGYRYQLTEIREVSGWSGFFSIAARSGANRSVLEAVATSNATTRAQFFWRTDAINIYINNTSSGVCSFPDDGDNAIFCGSSAYDTLFIHEMGHYFTLAHTHSGEQFLNSNGSDCSAGDCSCAQLVPGTNDGFADTLPDVDCWSRSQMVAANPAASATQIDNTFLNIMSYHTPQDRFTSSQLDAWTDGANGPRLNAVNGRTRFVATTGNDLNAGTSGSRFRTVVRGVAAASDPDDVVLLRAGSYNEPQTITKALTIRATRGDALIGKP